MKCDSKYRPKDAAKALKKRLAGNKNFKSVLLTLTVRIHDSEHMTFKRFLVFHDLILKHFLKPYYAFHTTFKYL